MTPVDPRRIRLVSAGIVASYIHDISARTGSGAARSRRAGPLVIRQRSPQSAPGAPLIRFGAPKSLTSALLPVQDRAPLTVLPTSIGPYSPASRL